MFQLNCLGYKLNWSKLLLTLELRGSISGVVQQQISVHSVTWGNGIISWKNSLPKPLISWNVRWFYSLDLIKLRFTPLVTLTAVYDQPSSTKSSKSLGIHVRHRSLDVLKVKGFDIPWNKPASSHPPGWARQQKETIIVQAQTFQGGAIRFKKEFRNFVWVVLLGLIKPY